MGEESTAAICLTRESISDPEHDKNSATALMENQNLSDVQHDTKGVPAPAVPLPERPAKNGGGGGKQMNVLESPHS